MQWLHQNKLTSIQNATHAVSTYEAEGGFHLKEIDPFPTFSHIQEQEVKTFYPLCQILYCIMIKNLILQYMTIHISNTLFKICFVAQ